MSWAEDWGHDMPPEPWDDQHHEENDTIHTIKFSSLLHETPLAYLVRIDDAEHWLPKSECDLISDDFLEGGEIDVPAWLLDKKGLHY